MIKSNKYYDDSIIRSIIVGCINLLNNKIKIYVKKNDENDEIIEYKVPFFYSMSNDERFIQDYYLHWGDCSPENIEGGLMQIPRGRIYASGISIKSSELTNRYVRGIYTKEEHGEIKQYSSYINSIPIQISLDSAIIFDTINEGFKIIESIISTLYKTQVFNVIYKGMKVPVQIGFPESYNYNSRMEIKEGTPPETYTITLSLECNSFMPVIDQEEERFLGENIEGFAIYFDEMNSKNNIDEKEHIIFKK